MVFCHHSPPSRTFLASRLPLGPLWRLAWRLPERPRRHRNRLQASSRSLACKCKCFLLAGIAPAPVWRYPINFVRAPGSWCILMNRRVLFQDRFHDPPGFFDVVFAREQRTVSGHCCSEHALVCVHLVRAWSMAGNHFTSLKRESFSVWSQVHHSHRDRDFWTQPEADMVFDQLAVGNQSRRLAKLGDDLRASRRQAFAGANVKWHSFPAPGIDFQLHDGEGLGLRVLRNPVFIAVTAELAANKVLFLDRWNRSQHFGLFVADRFAVGADGRFHRQIRQDLEEMVLDHIADRSSLIVKPSAALNPEVFRHRDLDALNVVAVPEGLHKCVGEAERHHIVHSSLTEVMVDAEDVGFIEGTEQNLVQFLRGCQIVPEGLLDYDARAPPTVGHGEMFDDGFKQNRRDCQIMCRAFRIFEFPAKRSKGRRILVVAVDIAQQTYQLFESGRIKPAMLPQAVFCASAQLIEVPSSFGNPNHRDIEVTPLYHRLEGRENLFVCKISGGAEENERVRVSVSHEILLQAASDFSFGFSKCPPNSNRIADRSLSA